MIKMARQPATRHDDLPPPEIHQVWSLDGELFDNLQCHHPK